MDEQIAIGRECSGLAGDPREQLAELDFHQELHGTLTDVGGKKSSRSSDPCAEDHGALRATAQRKGGRLLYASSLRRSTVPTPASILANRTKLEGSGTPVSLMRSTVTKMPSSPFLKYDQQYR